jgi:hypothetical protein
MVQEEEGGGTADTILEDERIFFSQMYLHHIYFTTISVESGASQFPVLAWVRVVNSVKYHASQFTIIRLKLSHHSDT